MTAYDPDSDPLTYSWSKVSGPGSVTFADAGSSTTQASFSTAGSYDIRVTVSDGELSNTSSTTVTVVEPNLAPVIDTPASAAPSVIEIDHQTTLSVSASDPNGDSLSYSWSKVSGPGSVNFSNGNLSTTQASFSTIGTYSLKVTVSDGALSATSSTLVTVNPPAPDPIINETGTVTASQSSRDSWKTVNLQNAFSDPVVIFSPLTYNDQSSQYYVNFLPVEN